jgi:hypothetical protein
MGATTVREKLTKLMKKLDQLPSDDRWFVIWYGDRDVFASVFSTEPGAIEYARGKARDGRRPSIYHGQLIGEMQYEPTFTLKHK